MQIFEPRLSSYADAFSVERPTLLSVKPKPIVKSSSVTLLDVQDGARSRSGRRRGSRGRCATETVEQILLDRFPRRGIPVVLPQLEQLGVRHDGGDALACLGDQLRFGDVTCELRPGERGSR